MEILAGQYYCMAIDLPGHGNTAYRKNIVSSFRHFLEKESNKPTLVGYSMGGRIALQLRDCVKGIVAIGAHVGLETDEEKQAHRALETGWKEKLLTLPSKQFFKSWYSQPLFASLSEKPFLLESLIKKRIKQDPIILEQVMTQLSLADQNRVTLFPTPTLLIHGEKDRKYQQLYHNIQLPVSCVNNAGHACLIENPQGCGLTILNGLERLYANDK